MRKQILVGAFAASTTMVGQKAAADGLEFGVSALITSDLIRSGESLTDGRPGAALEAEGEIYGFFAGIELLTLRDRDDRWQVALFAGHAFDVGMAEIEFGVAQAWADGSGAGDTELFAGVEFALGERTTLGLEAVYTPGPQEWADLPVMP